MKVVNPLKGWEVQILGNYSNEVTDQITYFSIR